MIGSGLTLLQSLSFAALGPSLFAIVFLLLLCRPLKQAVIPSLYFFSLSASFLLPLLPFISSDKNLIPTAALLTLESLSAALCYLLILELFYRKSVPLSHWLILALPIAGGAPFIYGKLFEAQVCIFGVYCADSNLALDIYHIFCTAIIFLLLIAHFSRSEIEIEHHRPARRHTYWLIITLIILNLALPALELATLGRLLSATKVELLSLLLRISFIYLALTSLFRIYGSPLQVETNQLPTFTRVVGRKPLDEAGLLERIQTLMRHEAPYRTANFNREELARMMGIPEQTVSRVLNQHLGKNFNEFINTYRLEEAKTRLQQEQGSINQIAYGVGFNSIASFNRVFKLATGLSPTQFRQEHVGKTKDSGKQSP